MSAPSPSAVGNKFVVSYYTQLNQNPGSLRHFYKENAVLTHGSESSFGASDETVSGVEEINKKIQKLDFRDCHVTLSVVDCQASQNGFLVLVVGHLSNKAEPPRKFVQTFFLSEQNKAFFVLNDVFRFVEESKAQEAPVAAAPEPAAKEEPAPQPITQEPPHPEPIDTKPKEIKPSAPAPSSLETSPEEQAVEPVVPRKVTAPPPRNETWNVPKKESAKPSAPAKKVTASPPPPPQEEKPTGPKSWSNVVGGASGSVVPQSSPPVEAAAQPAQGARKSTPQQPQKQRREKVEDKTGTPSLFVNNVPFGVSEEQMRGVFSQFGEIKSVGIIGNKGFVFLEYATVEQAQKAIDGAKNGQLSMDGRVLTVVESKKEKKQGGSKDKGSRPPRDRPDRVDRDTRGERRERGDGKPSNGKQSAAKQ